MPSTPQSIFNPVPTTNASISIRRAKCWCSSPTSSVGAFCLTMATAPSTK